MKMFDLHHWLVMLRCPLVLLPTKNTLHLLDRHQNLKAFHYIEGQLEQYALLLKRLWLLKMRLLDTRQTRLKP
jgi:hypothetical protein